MARKSTPAGKTDGFTAEERAAMKDRAAELKKARSRGKKKDGEADLLEKVAEMSDADRAMATRLHAIITKAAPELKPQTWYGMPAYARDGKAVCFFQAAEKFKTRYATLGFNETARLDDGAMWPTAFALTELNATTEARIIELVKRAAG